MPLLPNISCGTAARDLRTIHKIWRSFYCRWQRAGCDPSVLHRPAGPPTLGVLRVSVYHAHNWRHGVGAIRPLFRAGTRRMRCLQRPSERVWNMLRTSRNTGNSLCCGVASRDGTTLT